MVARLMEAGISQHQQSEMDIELSERKPKQNVVAMSPPRMPSPSIEDSSSRRLSVNVVEQEDVPPNGGYGWVCTACVFLINAHTWGVNAAWAIFLAHYLSNSTFPGATHFEYALIGGLSISTALFIAPFVAMSVRHVGTRITLLMGTAIIFASLFSASYAHKIWHLFLSQGVCFGCGMGFLYIPATAVLPQWFSTRRSLAVGIASSGAGLGGLAYNLIAGRAVQTVGLVWTYRILAFCALGVNLTCAILLKDRNKKVKPQQTAFAYREYGRIEVILVIAWGFLTELGYICLLYSLPSYANSIGLNHNQGAVVSAVLNLGLGISRPVVGYWSDSLGRINIATIMTAFCGVVCLSLWVPAKSYGLLLVFALLAGTGCGVFWGTSVSIMAEVVGLKRLPSAFGMMCLALVVPTTFGEAVALEIVSASGGFLASQVYVGCLFLVGAASVWFLRSWRITEIEKKARLERQIEDVVLVPSRRRDFWLTPRKLFMLRRV